MEDSELYTKSPHSIILNGKLNVCPSNLGKTQGLPFLPLIFNVTLDLSLSPPSIIWVSHNTNTNCAYLSVLPCLPCNKKRRGGVVTSLFCVAHILTGHGRLLVASSLRKDASFSACVHTRSHQLRKTMHWPVRDRTSSPLTTPLPIL